MDEGASKKKKDFKGLKVGGEGWIDLESVPRQIIFRSKPIRSSKLYAKQSYERFIPISKYFGHLGVKNR